MNNRGNNDFDELEPRITPQPTALKCMTPSVPEVSIIFGKRPEPPQPPKTPRSHPEQKYETYASWKKDEFPSSLDPKPDSRYALQLLNKSSTNNSLVPLKSSLNNSPTFPPNPIQKFPETPQKTQYQNQSSKNLALRDPNSETTRPSVENIRFHNYGRHSPETSSFPFPPNKSIDSPVQKRYDGVKSILKSSQLERTEGPNSPSSPDGRFQRKVPSHIQSPRNLIPDHSRQSAARYHRQIDPNHDQGTVQDLLLLVQNQNEQIKALQNQVERLLKAHEESLVNREVRNSASRKQYESPQSPNYDLDHRNAAPNPISPQKSCHPRGMKIMSPFPAEESPDMCLRYQSDQMRNTIMEKKVSIGVMTSFEFSVHNNPFVSDSDHQINAVLRECKNIDPSENWRRNMAPGPLENINEDNESYPSSLWKQSNNNTQMSSNSKRTSVANDNRTYSQSGNQCSPISEDIGCQSAGNDSGNFQKANSTPQPPIPAPRKISMSNRNQRQIPVVYDQRIQNPDVFGNSGFHKVAERESCDPIYVQDRNKYNREKAQVFGDPFPGNNERFPRNLESLNPGLKSMENTDEASLVLSGSELKVNNRPPSPDPSIHVEMREYSSDDENEKTKRAPPVGWTFYKNIVGQVNRILHTIPDTKDMEENGRDDGLEAENEGDGQNEEAVDSVKLATMERLKMLGISYAEHSEYTGETVQKKVTFDSSYCPRLDYQTTLPQSTNTVTESNTSMHMKALALKYLSDEQLADLAVQKQGDGNGMKQKILNSVHGTNMSLATMNYLQRYCLVSGVNSPHAEGKGHVNAIRQKKLKHVVMTKELHAQQMPRHHAFNESANSQKGPDNILDITTLKQQPKLL